MVLKDVTRCTSPSSSSSSEYFEQKALKFSENIKKMSKNTSFSHFFQCDAVFGHQSPQRYTIGLQMHMNIFPYQHWLHPCTSCPYSSISLAWVFKQVCYGVRLWSGKYLGNCNLTICYNKSNEARFLQSW